MYVLHSHSNSFIEANLEVVNEWNCVYCADKTKYGAVK